MSDEATNENVEERIEKTLNIMLSGPTKAMEEIRELNDRKFNCFQQVSDEMIPAIRHLGLCASPSDRRQLHSELAKAGQQIEDLLRAIQMMQQNL